MCWLSVGAVWSLSTAQHSPFLQQHPQQRNQQRSHGFILSFIISPGGEVCATECPVWVKVRALVFFFNTLVVVCFCQRKPGQGCAEPLKQKWWVLQ